MSDILRQLTANLIPTVSGGAYQDAREVSIVWNTRRKHRFLPKFRCRMQQIVTKRPFSPPSFPARRKRRGRRRRVRNDHDGTSRRKRRLFSSVLVSSFPNRKLNLRFGFSCKFVATSQSRLRRASIPTPFVPSGHFPLIGGIGPWKGSLSFRCGGGYSPSGATQRSWVSME